MDLSEFQSKLKSRILVSFLFLLIIILGIVGTNFYHFYTSQTGFKTFATASVHQKIWKDLASLINSQHTQSVLYLTTENTSLLPSIQEGNQKLEAFAKDTPRKLTPSEEKALVEILTKMQSYKDLFQKTSGLITDLNSLEKNREDLEASISEMVHTLTEEAPNSGVSGKIQNLFKAFLSLSTAHHLQFEKKDVQPETLEKIQTLAASLEEASASVFKTPFPSENIDVAKAYFRDYKEVSNKFLEYLQTFDHLKKEQLEIYTHLTSLLETLQLLSAKVQKETYVTTKKLNEWDQALIMSLSGGAALLGIFIVIYLIRSLRRIFEDLQSESRVYRVPHSIEIASSSSSHPNYRDISNTLQAFKQQALQVVQWAEEQRSLTEEKETAEFQVAREVEIFSISLEEKARTFLHFIESLVDQIETLTKGVKDVENEFNSTAAATEHLTSHLQGLSQTVDAISHSLQTSGEKLQRSTVQSYEALKLSQNAKDAPVALKENIGKIEKMGSSLNELANHLNRLALNVTIETSKAGDSGKNFAVLTSEVRTIANTATQLSDEASHLAYTLQSTTDGSLSRLPALYSLIEQMNTLTSEATKEVTLHLTSAQQLSRKMEWAIQSMETTQTNLLQGKERILKNQEEAETLLKAEDHLTISVQSLQDHLQIFLKKLKSDLPQIDNRK
jgi:methyl-accepting chemotaxis protein